MPPALAEVEKAVALISESVALRSGAARGRSRATRAQALRLLSTGRPDVLAAHIAREAWAALDELDAEDRPLQWIACISLLTEFAPEAAATLPVREIDIDAVRARHGDSVAITLLTAVMGDDVKYVKQAHLGKAISELVGKSPDLVLTSDQRNRFLDAAVHSTDEQVLTCADLESTGTAGPDHVAVLNAAHDAGEITDSQYGRTLAHIAAHTADDSARALELARAADEWCALDSSRPMTTWLVATSALRLAIDDSADIPVAVDAAAEAAAAFVSLNMHVDSRMAVRVAMSRAAKAEDDRGAILLTAFGRRLLRLEVLGDAEDREGLYGLGLVCSTGSMRSTEEAGNPVAILAQSQLFKGLLFSVALDGAGPWALDATESATVRQVGELEQLARIESEAEPDDEWESDIGFFDDHPELLRCAFLSVREGLAGRDAEARLANARLDLDEQVTRRRYGGRLIDQLDGLGDLVPALSHETVCAALGDDTVLLDIFLGLRLPGHLRTVYITASTANQTVIHVLKEHDADQGVAFRDPSEHGRLVVVHPLAHRMAALRRELQQYSAPNLLTRDAEELLSAADGYLFGSLGETLAELRASGHTHLCVWPHGPLHFAPIHLMQAQGRTLADDWTVTVIPSTRCLLEPRFRTGTPAQHAVLAVGVPSGGTAFGMPTVHSLRDQAQRVAASFGSSALAEERATPREVLRQMELARYVHLAAHGSASGGSPLWQHLYLTAGDDGEGRLFAHDVLGADLRNVDLVTLSACESALGRFDALDDLRGLPAALLLAGAQAIIGTLWPVHPEPAADFFGRLYEQLAAGQPRLAAFREAQLATRLAYPEYRHWGAFTYIGGWK